MHCDGNVRRLDGTFIQQLAKAHYTSQYNPPRKAFDFYAAAALVYFMTSKDLLGLSQSQLFYSAEYGLSLVGKSETWEATLESYVSRIDTKVDPGDSDFIKTKKEYFQREISVMRTLEDLPKLMVRFHNYRTCSKVFLIPHMNCQFFSCAHRTFF
jgi:hypothetical protein